MGHWRQLGRWWRRLWPQRSGAVRTGLGPAKKRRRYYRGSERPVGPKLVAGRGLNRRRADITAPFRWAIYLTLGLAAWYAMFKLLLGG